MIADVSHTQLLIAVLVVMLGTAVQASVGFGLAVISAPILALVNRSFVPAPLILIALVLTCWMAYRERSSIDFGNLKAALAGRLLGTPPAAFLMGVMSVVVFDFLFGSLVLMAVVISLIHGNLRPTRKAVFFAAIASGFMSTISSIGGPPMALVYQNVRGAELRANLSVLFIMGCLVSLSALWVVGRLGMADVALAGVLLLGVALGLLLSRPLKSRLEKRAIRPWLLGLCSVSAVLVLARAVSELP